jgi:hypothetical protein
MIRSSDDQIEIQNYNPTPFMTGNTRTITQIKIGETLVQNKCFTNQETLIQNKMPPLAFISAACCTSLQLHAISRPHKDPY